MLGAHLKYVYPISHPEGSDTLLAEIQSKLYRPQWCNVTVAQRMEGDEKKEDLTVLLGTSTHRTPKMRSSVEILQRLRQRYLQFLHVVVDVLTDEVSYRDFEDRLRQELDAPGRDIVKWVVESCDERLREEPQTRPGWVVARRGDEKQLLTPFGMVSCEQTYFRHRAGKQYSYLADAVIGVTPHQRVNDGVKARLVERAVEQSYRKSGRWAQEEAWHVSTQTVMTALRQTRVPDERKAPGTKRRVKYLFVEADEDHVPRQHGGRL